MRKPQQSKDRSVAAPNCPESASASHPAEQADNRRPFAGLWMDGQEYLFY